MNTAQDLREAAINDTGRNLDLVASHVAYAFVGATEWPECLDSLGHRTFLLIVAEALDYREPMSSITVLRGCLEHPDAGDAISALQHAIAQPVIAPTPVHWVMLTDEEILFAWNLRGKDGILGSLRDVETALIAKQGKQGEAA